MPRGKKIVIETKVDDDAADQFRSIDLEDIRSERRKTEKDLSSSLSEVFKAAGNLYQQRTGEKELQRKHGLYSVKSAYEYLRENGIPVSFRAFGGRIERGTIPFVKVGRRRFIPRTVLKDIVGTQGDFHTVREAYDIYCKHNRDINFRAFIGRIEKGAIPSVKFGTRRLIPREAIDSLTRISKNYYSVSQAMKELSKMGIKMKRNAFERRLDRGRIPHEKVGGRRFIHETVLREVVNKEIAHKNN